MLVVYPLDSSTTHTKICFYFCCWTNKGSIGGGRVKPRIRSIFIFTEMKFMKLGSKPDSFKTDGDNMRYVATELATDIVVNVGDVKFYLHKFPLLSKSARLQKLVAATNVNGDDVDIQDIPGGAVAFEICAKFCYGMTVTLNAYNVVAARCAAEYLEMHENVEKGNLIYKIEVFLNSSIFRSWKDSIIVLQTTRSFLPWSEELKVVSHCLDSIASKASIDTSKVEWSYTYNRKKLPSENETDVQWNGVRKSQMVPKDWWVEDLCVLHIDLFKRVIATVKTKGKVPGDVIGEALSAYSLRRVPGFSKGTIEGDDLIKYRSLVETIVLLLPTEKNSTPCSFLLKLLRAAIILECGEMERRELMRKIGQQLDEAKVGDLMIRSSTGETTMFDAEIVQNLVQEFLAYEQTAQKDPSVENGLETKSHRFESYASEGMVAKLVDGYLAEISRDTNLSPSKFVDLAEMVPSFSRPSHDGIYRAIDMYLKEHPGISKSERNRICRLMDCKKLSADACLHAVQNERLPLRVVVQVLFIEQAREPEETRGSSRSTTTNTEEKWDSVPTTQEIKALKEELASLRSGAVSNDTNIKNTVGASKTKGMVVTKMFSKLWSSKERHGDGSSSDTSGSTNADETSKSTRSTSRKHSLS